MPGRRISMCKGPSETSCPERSKTDSYSWAQSEGGWEETRPHRALGYAGDLGLFS